MARTALSVQTVSSSGLDPTLEAANVDGNSIPLTDGMLVLLRNEDTIDHTVTVPTPVTVSGLDVAERTVTVPAGTDRYLALAGGRAYRQPDGSAHLDYDDVTALSVALLHVR